LNPKINFENYFMININIAKNNNYKIYCN